MVRQNSANTSFRYAWFWLAVTALLLGLCYTIHGILAPFIIALVLSYFLNPLVIRLVHNKALPMPRSLATLLAIISLIMLLAAFVLMIVPVFYTQISLIVHIITEKGTNLQPWPKVNAMIEAIDPEMAKQIEGAAAGLARHVLSFIGNVLHSALQSSFAVVSLLALIFITPILTFYILRDWPKLLASLNNLLPPRYASEVHQLARDLDSVLTGYLHGQTAVCIVLSIFYVISLGLIGLDSSFTLGVITGTLTFIPYVGVLFGGALAVIVAAVQFASIKYILVVLGVFAIGNALEGNFITPKLIGDRVGLHPAWIIFGLFAGGYLGGLLGMFVSFPLTAVVGVFIRFALTKYQQSTFYIH